MCRCLGKFQGSTPEAPLCCDSGTAAPGWGQGGGGYGYGLGGNVRDRGQESLAGYANGMAYVRRDQGQVRVRAMPTAWLVCAVGIAAGFCQERGLCAQQCLQINVHVHHLRVNQPVPAR